MKTILSRLFQPGSDLDPITRLWLACCATNNIQASCSPTDLHEALAQEAIRANTRLWLESGNRLLAYAYVDPYRNLKFDIAPGAESEEMECMIIAWGVKCVRRMTSPEEIYPTLDASCQDNDHARLNFLNRHGFIQEKGETHRYERTLQDEIPKPKLPAGFLIRPLMGIREIKDWVALHRAAFGTNNMTVEERFAMMGAGVENAGYLPELDLVAVCPDGRLAGYVFCSIVPHHNSQIIGFTDPIAVHPEHQRSGLGKALLLNGLYRLKAHGALTARLSTSNQNIAMQKTAASAGFSTYSRSLWFSKALPESD